ncbi:MAG: PepSY-associated TM helix domain-containing protein [Acidobacteriota bacterium]
MSILSEAIQKPQQLALRKMLFQVHLWTGIGVGLYILLISVTGAAIVFQEEMEHAIYSELTHASNVAGPQAAIGTVIENARSAYRGYHVESVFLPTEDVQTFGIEMRTDDLRVVAYAHPVTAKILGHRERDRPFLEILNDLHHNLLAGKTGRLVNGFGGLFLGILCITGAIIWWPGIKNWKRSLKVDLGKKWKRVNWDLHSASGFWTLALIALWAVTGAYFTWDDEIKEAINYVSPLSQPKQPKSDVAMKGRNPYPAIDSLVGIARNEFPDTRLSRISLPKNDEETIRIMMARGELRDRRATDNLYFDQFTGKLLGKWQRGIHRSAGDVIVYWISPLHYGDFGGVWVKALWVALGLAPALLL